jgi:hypothetical protein
MTTIRHEKTDFIRAVNAAFTTCGQPVTLMWIADACVTAGQDRSGSVLADTPNGELAWDSSIGQPEQGRCYG